ncbi:GDSL-type esterase/lipase family protein [Methylorubrum rhodesianum]|uniref:GDSL-type esterase/lipase family protein n=1 Tax=Methylorubrum rhodesianum TaxID=29427 RepID=UPI0037456ACB
MSVTDWSPQPSGNAVADRAIAAIDGASGREIPGMVRSVMAGVRRYADSQGGALVTGGRLNAYTVDTALGVTELRPGLSLIVKVDRDNTAEATLNVDGSGPLPWVDAAGVRLLAGRILAGRFYNIILDADALAWRVQAGASTLDEIPGLIDLQDGVAANAADVSAKAEQTSTNAATVAQQSAAVETARAQVATNTQAVSTAATQVAQDKAAAEIARGAAVAASTQAQGAIGNNRVIKDTLAGLNAALNYPDGTIGEVVKDPGPVTATAGNGYYAKVGASGTGSWTKKSDATVPGLDARTGFIDINFLSTEGDLAHFVDAVKRLVLLITSRGYVQGIFEDPTGAPYLRDVELGLDRVANVDGDFRTWRDAIGRVMLVLAGTGHLQGRFETLEGIPYATQADIPAGLADRLNRGLSTYGLLRDAEVFSPAGLRETHKRLRVLDRLGGLLNGANCQLSMLIQGDSWSTTTMYYVQQLTQALVAKYGDAGPGWTGFGFSGTGVATGNARPDVLALTRTGSWLSYAADATNLYGTAPMPDHSAAVSTASGDTFSLQYNKPVNGPDISAIELFAIASNTATAQYRFNGGMWVPLDLTGSGFKAIGLGAIPTGSFNLQVQSLSAGAYLGGALYKSTAKGVVVHKAGASGTRSQQWASVDPAIYQASLAALAPNLLFCLGGTNSQSAYPAESERGYVQTLINRWKTALPAADICLATPPENVRVNAVRMADIAEAQRQLAHQNAITHLNLQSAFGDADNPSSYADGSARPMLDSSLIHPSYTNGAFGIADRILRLMESA